MLFEATIATSLMATKEIERYNAACKQILSEKAILAYILKVCVDEFSSCEIDEIVKSLSQDNVIDGQVMGMDTVDEGIRGDKVVYDLLVHTRQPNLHIDIEVQNNFYVKYPLLKRAAFYVAKLIVGQAGTVFTHSEYDKLNKVYSLWLCLDPPKYKQNCITAYSIRENQIIGNMSNKKAEYDIAQVVMICIGNEIENQETRMKFFNLLFSTAHSYEKKKEILEKEYGIPMTVKLKGGIYEMCNAGEGLARKYLKQGIEEGYEKAILDNLKNVMVAFNVTIYQALDALKVSEEEKDKYIRLMQAL